MQMDIKKKEIKEIKIEDKTKRLVYLDIARTFTMSIATFVLFQGINIKNKYICKITNDVGYNTLSIFYMHIPILMIFIKYMYKYIKIQVVAVNFLKTIIVIFIIYIITIILKKIPIIRKIVM